jgi:2-C-methyl-D-erythritol 2,4-cyclodiphosphate synthase
MNYKIGLGQDSHKFDQEKKLILGGVEIPDHPGMQGNSDGDVILHAVFNAISSALGQGSIGKHADPLCLEQGISCSQEYLKVVLGMLESNTWQINNISISVEAKTPKLEQYITKMESAISKVLNIQPDQVGITVTSGEGLTACGRGEGIGVTAIAMLKK